MTDPVTYIAGADLADLEITWLDQAGQAHDFTADGGWTFTVRIGRPGRAPLLTKTTGITGHATAPNVIVSWDAGELEAVTPGAHTLEVVARRVDGKERVMQAPFEIDPAVLGP